MKDKLPKGWEWKNLGDIAEYINGSAFKPSDWGNIGLPIIRIQNLNGNNTYNYYNGEVNEKYLVKNGDILISWSASLDVYKWNNGKAILNQHIFNTKINSRIVDENFFYLLIKYALDEIKSKVHGVGMQHITKGKFEKINIPLPPLPEQKQIVSVLDKTFEKLDQAIALVEENIQKLKQLNESILDELFGELLKKEKIVELEDLTHLVTKGSSPKWQGVNYSDRGVLFITSENVIAYKIDLSKKKYVEEKFNFIEPRSILKKGDVLMNIVGASIGRTAVFELDEVANINQAVCLIRLNNELINNTYALHFFNSSICINYMFDMQVDNARANLSMGNIKKFKIPLPTIPEQQRIVAYLDQTTKKNQKLIQYYQNKLEALQRLKNSVLDNAFKGELRKEKVIAKQPNINFYYMQVIGASIQANRTHNIAQGEMAIAKDMYLLDRLYDVPTQMNFVNHSWGPFAPVIKKVINNNTYFGRKKFPNSNATYVDILNEETLLKTISSQVKTQIIEGIITLNQQLFSKVSPYKRAETKELLATVLKCIEDTQSVELIAIRQAMQNWKIEQGKFKTKADKFPEKDTTLMIKFIVKENWHLKVLK